MQLEYQVVHLFRFLITEYLSLADGCALMIICNGLSLESSEDADNEMGKGTQVSIVDGYVHMYMHVHIWV